MEIKKSISIKSFVIFVILIATLSYFFLYRPYLKKQEAIRKISSELKTKVYPNLSFSQGVIYTGNDYTWYTLRGVTDGKAITDPLEIKAKNGTLLAISKLAYKVYYLDQNNKLKVVIVILLAELADNLNNYIVFDSEIGIIPKDKYQEKFNRLTGLIGTNGKVIAVSFFTDNQNIDQQNLMIQKQGRSVTSSFRALQDFLKQYLQNREPVMNKFTIGKSLDILLPIGFTSETYNKNLIVNPINLTK